MQSKGKQRDGARDKNMHDQQGTKSGNNINHSKSFPVKLPVKKPTSKVVPQPWNFAAGSRATPWAEVCSMGRKLNDCN